MHKIVFCLLALAICLILNQKVALACGCGGDPALNTQEKIVKNARDRAAAVFSGKVLEVIERKESPRIEIKFRVGKSWKGVFTDEVSLFQENRTNCDFYFEEGVEYLVYAFTHNDTNELQTNVCTLTKKLAKADEDIKILGDAVFVGEKETSDGISFQRRPKSNNSFNRSGN